MNHSSLAALVALVFMLGGCAPHVPSPGRYSSDEIKTLAPNEIRGLPEGEDVGYSRAAELNDYPGPARVLANAAALRLPTLLSRTQLDRFAALRRVQAQLQ